MNLPQEHYHFIGIGGSGMSALAAALLDIGARVSGSDLAASDSTRALEERGARIYIGHSAENLKGATRVVLTGAVPADNPELRAAQDLALPIVKRAALLGLLMDARRGIAVAGTAGKTTTSAMISWVLAKAGRDPSYMVGSTIHGLGAGGYSGSGAELVAEADEYDRSFLHLHPEVAVITNIESDHLEYYGTAEAIHAAFGEFALNVRPGGLLVLCADDPGAIALYNELSVTGAPFRLQLYGLGSHALWRADRLATNDRGGTSYALSRNGRDLAKVSLRVPGRHNVLNSLGAFAACVDVGVAPAEVTRWLSEFAGTGRRFDVRGEAAGVTIVDDYAHHPTKVAAALDAARQRFPGRRIVVLFQPHTYTRTRDFLVEFAEALQNSDFVVVTEIYASRERDTLGMSGRHIVERISGPQAFFCATLVDAKNFLLDELHPQDVLLTMGAGDVWKAGEEIFELLRAGEEESQESAPATTLHIPQAAGETRKGNEVKPGAASVSFAPDIARRLEEVTHLKVIRDEPMSKHNSLRIGGPAKFFVTVGETADLVAVVLFARRHGVPYLILGNGTNILAGDYGIDGLIIHNKTHDISHEVQEDGSSIWQVASGVLFSRLARITCEAGWTGIEWAASVPGSVGGGVVSNAGAHGKELKDDLLSIEVLTAEGVVEEWLASTLELGYRASRFKAHGKRALSPPEVILSAHIVLHPDTENKCELTMRTYLEERQAKQPQGKSAGSTFKNTPAYTAGYLIEQVGLKGYRHGQAQFSSKHANFMMNLGGATAVDVLALIKLAQDRVREKFGIEIEPEIELVGEI